MNNKYGAGGSRTHVQTPANTFVYNHRLCIGFNFALTHNSSQSQASLLISYQVPRQDLIVSRYY